MTEPTKPEGTAEQVNQELPTPKFTDVSPDSATSSVDMDALAEKVASKLRPSFEKVAQSTKDKRIAEIQKRLGMQDLAELEEMGAQIPDNVKLEYRLRQIEGQRQPDSPAQTSTSQGSGANLAVQEVSEAVRKFNLDANDPEVIEKLRGTYRNRDHFEATLAQVALAKVNKPQPSAAESSSLEGHHPSAAPDMSAKLARLAELQKFPSRHRDEIQALTKELEARGWK